MRMSPRPISVIAFARPEYFERLASSLQGSLRDSDVELQVHIFQDGLPDWADAEMRIRHAQIAEIAKRYLPTAVLHASQGNLGIANNWRRAQKYCFEELKQDSGIFLEEDVELSSCAVEVLSMLARMAESKPNIAYLSPYGQYRGMDQSLPLHGTHYANRHLRAFAQGRDSWLKLDSFLAPFFRCMLGLDYSDVDLRQRRLEQELSGWFEAIGSMPRPMSQDAFRAWAATTLGLGILHTDHSWVRYIGRSGLHGNEANFDAVGYEETVLATAAPSSFTCPSESDLDVFVNSQRQYFAEQLRLRESALHGRGDNHAPCRSQAKELLRELEELGDTNSRLSDLSHAAEREIQRLTGLLARSEAGERQRALELARNLRLLTATERQLREVKGRLAMANKRVNWLSWRVAEAELSTQDLEYSHWRLDDEAQRLEMQVKELDAQLREIFASRSWRIGRLVTAPVRVPRERTS